MNNFNNDLSPLFSISPSWFSNPDNFFNENELIDLLKENEEKDKEKEENLKTQNHYIQNPNLNLMFNFEQSFNNIENNKSIFNENFNNEKSISHYNKNKSSNIELSNKEINNTIYTSDNKIIKQKKLLAKKKLFNDKDLLSNFNNKTSLTDEEKKQRTKIKNRISAQEFRDKKNKKMNRLVEEHNQTLKLSDQTEKMINDYRNIFPETQVPSFNIENFCEEKKIEAYQKTMPEILKKLINEVLETNNQNKLLKEKLHKLEKN